MTDWEAIWCPTTRYIVNPMTREVMSIKGHALGGELQHEGRDYARWRRPAPLPTRLEPEPPPSTAEVFATIGVCVLSVALVAVLITWVIRWMLA